MGLNLKAYRLRRGLTQTQVVAEIYKRAVARGDGKPGLDPCAVSRHENGHKRPGPYYQRLYCEIYEASPDELGFLSPPAGEAEPDFAELEPADVLAMTLTPDSAQAALSRAARQPKGFDDFVAALVQQDTASLRGGAPVDLPAWEQAASVAKRNLQACRYALAISQLTSLLRGLPTVGASLDGDDVRRSWSVGAHAYRTAAGLLLKLGHDGLAHIAADRSMAFAKRSQDPLTVGSSARIVAHALLRSGHFREARTTATSAASRLDARNPTPHRLSVVGSLLLRGAIAAALAGDRTGALELLDEADNAAKPFGADRNDRWTAFGPTNVLLHRVHVAVTLGDAGTALEHARAVDLNKLAVTERRACLYIDAARALVQWGRYAEACHMLTAAQQLAPEELTSRPSVRAMVGDMVRRAPRSAQPAARALAIRVSANP
jgi:transcriptional regulator with XRE-family HTH domain